MNTAELSDPYAAPAADIGVRTDSGGDFTPFYSPRGRFGRLSYLAWMMVTAFLFGIVMIPLGTLASAAGGEIGMIFLMFSYVPLLLLTIVYGVRRLHDMSLSGWLSLLVIVPVLNVVFGLVLMLAPGTRAVNRFGPLRSTRSWEKVVGYIGIAFYLTAVVGIVAAIVIPVMVA